MKNYKFLSQHTNYLYKWLDHLNLDVFAAAKFSFFQQGSLIYSSLKQHYIWFDGLATY